MKKLVISLDNDFYETLGVDKKANEKQLKKAYRRLAMKCHPDRHKGSDEATQNFVNLGTIFEILSNKRKRRLYDTTGEIDTENNLEFEEEYKKYRGVFKEITKQDIEDFAKTYKKSEEEKEDVLTAYKECKGDCQKIMEWVPLAEIEDWPRYQEIIEEHIDELGFKRKYKKTKDQISLEVDPEEAAEAEELLKSWNVEPEEVEGEAGLLALFKGRQKMRQADTNSFLDSLMDKYGGNEEPPEIPEENFGKRKRKKESKSRKRSKGNRGKKKT